MRSIGKIKIRKLNKIIDGVWKDNKNALIPMRAYQLEESIIAMLPLEWWDTWEMADQEIRRLVSDELTKKVHKGE